MNKFIFATIVAACLFIISSCKSRNKNDEKPAYFAFTPEQMDVILTGYDSTVHFIGEPQVLETRAVLDSAAGLMLHEVSTTRNFQFTVQLNDKGEIIPPSELAAARKKNDCPGTGSITCRLRCIENGSGGTCSWSGCNSYPCSGGECSGGCKLLDCKQLRSGTGTKTLAIQ